MSTASSILFLESDEFRLSTGRPNVEMCRIIGIWHGKRRKVGGIPSPMGSPDVGCRVLGDANSIFFCAGSWLRTPQANMAAARDGTVLKMSRYSHTCPILHPYRGCDDLGQTVRIGLWTQLRQTKYDPQNRISMLVDCVETKAVTKQSREAFASDVHITSHYDYTLIFWNNLDMICVYLLYLPDACLFICLIDCIHLSNNIQFYPILSNSI